MAALNLDLTGDNIESNIDTDASSDVPSINDAFMAGEAAPAAGTQALKSVDATITAALNGELSPDYIHKYYDTKTLKPRHLKMLRMAFAGYSNNQIARAMGYTPARVSLILKHPDSRAILARMAGNAADQLNVAERLHAVAPEMLEHAIGVVRTTHNDALRLKGAFEILGRGGYAPKNTVTIADARETPSVAPAILRELTGVLREANALRDNAYDPTRRALSAAAASMSSGELVGVVESSPSLGSTSGGDTSHSDVPPGIELQQASPKVPAKVTPPQSIASSVLT